MALISGQSGSGSSNPWTSTSVVFAYSSADAPTFVATTASDMTNVIGVGSKLRLVQTTTKYFVVTAIDATTVTMYGGTDYTLVNAAITGVSYSNIKSPPGFPLQPEKWTVETILTSVAQKASPVANTWYGDTALTATGPNIVIPIGSWAVFWEAIGMSARAAGGIGAVTASLSTNAAAVGDLTLTSYTAVQSSGAQTNSYSMQAQSVITLAAKATYYLVVMTDQGTQTNLGLYTSTTFGRTFIRATCAYL